jgi:hypothetical protein
MSREAAEGSTPDIAEGIVPAAMASESIGTGEACATDEASEPPGPPETAMPAEQDKAPQEDAGSAPGTDDHDAGGPGKDALGAGPRDVDDLDDEDEEDFQGSLIEMAEPVELGEPGPVLPAPRRWPRLLLALGFVLLAAAIVAGAFAIVGSVTHGFKKPVKVTYTKSPVFSLKAGECIDPQGQSYTLIPCDSPHEAEVFATFRLTGTTWPGSTTVVAAASRGCATRLTGYLNPQLAVSLASTYVYPDATAWQAGTRTVICEVRAASGQLTGSVRGALATAG